MRKRTFIVETAGKGRPLVDWLQRRLAVTHSAANRLIRDRKVLLNGGACANPFRPLRKGERVEVLPAGGVPAKNKSVIPVAKKQHPLKNWEGIPPVISYIDEHVVVVDKPAGLTTMRHADEAREFGARAQRFLPPTLQDLLPDLLPESRSGKPAVLRAVHRLDKETTGLVVFARTAAAESHLGKQFRAHSTERLYLALVRGRPTVERIETNLVDDRGDGRRGSGSEAGVKAITHVRVVEEIGRFSLVECHLETGRTHQVRIHLGELGTPLCGERIYDRPTNGRPLPDGSGAKRVMLHAAELGFDHPVTGKRIRCRSAPPKDMVNLLNRLKRTIQSGS